jgi:glycosyltransferase involved in cell wall biosynthesis
MTEVSIILPTYNRGWCLSRSIRSVLAQSHQDFELIIVDDHSTDDTQEIVKQFVDTRIRYLRHPRNLGAASAINTGIFHSKGRFIAFQDSDDEWMPCKLEYQLEEFSEGGPSVGLVYCPIIKVERSRVYRVPASLESNRSEEILERLLLSNLISTQSIVVRRELIERSGSLDKRIPSYYDWEFGIRCCKDWQIRCADRGLVILHESEDSISSNLRKNSISRCIILKKHKDLFASNKHIMAKNYFVLSRDLAAINRLNGASIAIVKAIRARPNHFRFYFFYLIYLVKILTRRAF